MKDNQVNLIKEASKNHLFQSLDSPRGLGPLASSRYERGKNQPPFLLVKVLSLLEKRPNLLKEFREMNEPPR
ncbi:MAG: type II toxin-antitoxin system MqsA family antitoxin [Desulfomonilaceae bacterium]